MVEVTRCLRFAPLLVALGVISNVALPSVALAAAVAVINPGFEDISGESPVNEFTFGPLTGWDLYDPGSIADGGDGPTYFMGPLTPFEPDPIGAPDEATWR